jgi:hypothetical protein
VFEIVTYIELASTETVRDWEIRLILYYITSILLTLHFDRT